MYGENISGTDYIFISVVFMFLNAGVAYLFNIKHWKTAGIILGFGGYLGTCIILFWAAINKFRAEQAKKAVAGKENSTQQ